MLARCRAALLRPALSPCRPLSTKRVFPRTVIQTRSPYVAPKPPAFLTDNNDSDASIISVRRPRNTHRAMASSPYVVPDSDEEDPDLALAIKMSLQDTQVEASDPYVPYVPPSSSSYRVPMRPSAETADLLRQSKRKADVIVISDTESDEDPPPRKSKPVPISDTESDEDPAPPRKATGTYISPVRHVPNPDPSSATSPATHIKGNSIHRTYVPPTLTRTIKLAPDDVFGPKPSSFLGIDRAKMERERLARIANRPKQSLFIPVATQMRIQQIMPATAGEPLEDTKTASSYKPITIKPPQQASRLPDSTHGMKYPHGVVKKTWVKGFPRDGTDITFEEMFQKETLYGALLSAFQWEHEWVWTKVPPHQLQRFVLVMQGKTEDDRRAILSILGGLPKTTIVFPPMENVNCMHSKLMLLFHRNPTTGEDWLRIVVPSANLTSYDWGEGGTMENTVFMIDLPKLPWPKTSQTPFLDSLTTFCTASDYPADILSRLPHYDFTATAPLAFVHSIGGVHYSPTLETTGYPGLGTALTTLGYNSPRGLEVDFITGSMGSTTKDFIMTMYRAAQGHPGITEALSRASVPPPSKKQKPKQPKQPKPQRKGKGKQLLIDSDEDGQDTGAEEDPEVAWSRVKKRFRLYFPSRETVMKSLGGKMGAGTICFNSDMWANPEWPKYMLSDSESVRDGVLGHSKMLFARPPCRIGAGKIEAWAYVGSANFTESAWGKVVMDRGKRQELKIKCKNWECGVVVPVFVKDAGGHRLDGGAEPGRAGPLGMDVFDGVVPVPVKIPAVQIVEARRTPWFQQEIMGELSARQKEKKEKEQTANGFKIRKYKVD